MTSTLANQIPSISTMLSNNKNNNTNSTNDNNNTNNMNMNNQNNSSQSPIIHQHLHQPMDSLSPNDPPRKEPKYHVLVTHVGERKSNVMLNIWKLKKE